MKNIERLIVINPLKLDPRTGKPYNVLHKMGDEEIDAFKEHNNRFVDYIRKTDMIDGNYYINMYNNYGAS